VPRSILIVLLKKRDLIVVCGARVGVNALQHLCVDDHLDADDAHTGLPGRM
jgi:hypothetical protein